MRLIAFVARAASGAIVLPRYVTGNPGLPSVTTANRGTRAT